ncbi:Any1p [Sporobolomyces salmoneus]|uniref:Any1p n=1 Tax=Sporobolomyces salmoneus TaxID=183962 RepID=UPI00317A544F
MVAEWLTVVGGICMALFPPLAYYDQYISICRKRNSSGFSIDIPGLLIVANLTRCMYWLGARFQIYLLVQSFLMIGAQFGILYVCLLYRDPKEAERMKGKKKRPWNLWAWETFPPYLEFTALLILVHSILFLVFHKINFYIELLGFIALGLEATLPIPQLLVNYENKSTAGFRHTVLAGWFLGDAFKTIYYFTTNDNGIAFKTCALFQLSVDCMLLVQTFMYRKQTRLDLELRSQQFEEQQRGDEENQPSRAGQGGVVRGVAGPESLLNLKGTKNGNLNSREMVFELEEEGDSGSEAESEGGRHERSSLKPSSKPRS